MFVVALVHMVVSFLPCFSARVILKAVNDVFVGPGNELPVPFAGQRQYSHQLNPAGIISGITPGITPTNSGRFATNLAIYSKERITFVWL